MSATAVPPTFLGHGTGRPPRSVRTGVTALPRGGPGAWGSIGADPRRADARRGAPRRLGPSAVPGGQLAEGLPGPSSAPGPTSLRGPSAPVTTARSGCARGGRSPAGDGVGENEQKPPFQGGDRGDAFPLARKVACIPIPKQSTRDTTVLPTPTAGPAGGPRPVNALHTASNFAEVT